MGRVAVLAVTVGVLLFFLVTCDASISVRPTAKAKQPHADPRCVTVQTQYGQSYGDSSVATCGLASALQTSGERLEQQVQDVASATQRSLEGQRGQVEGLQGDVAALQGNDSVLRPLFGQVFASLIVPVCEIYTVGQAMEWARFGFRDENPNVHFVHIPCGDRCPIFFLSYIPGCQFRPNDDPGNFVSPLYNCLKFSGPQFDGLTCTRTVFIGNRGYTPNTAMLLNMDDWLVVDLFERVDPLMMAAMTRSLATTGDITPATVAMTGSLIGEGITPASATAIGDALRDLQLQSDP